MWSKQKIKTIQVRNLGYDLEYDYVIWKLRIGKETPVFFFFGGGGGEGRWINQKVTFTIDSTLLFRPALPGSLENWVLGYKISQLRGELDNEIANFELKLPTSAALNFASSLFSSLCKPM